MISSDLTVYIIIIVVIFFFVFRPALNLGANNFQICWSFRFILQTSFCVQYSLWWQHQIYDGICGRIYLWIRQSRGYRFNGSNFRNVETTARWYVTHLSLNFACDSNIAVLFLFSWNELTMPKSNLIFLYYFLVYTFFISLYMIINILTVFFRWILQMISNIHIKFSLSRESQFHTQNQLVKLYSNSR